MMRQFTIVNSCHPLYRWLAEYTFKDLPGDLPVILEVNDPGETMIGRYIVLENQYVMPASNEAGVRRQVVLV